MITLNVYRAEGTFESPIFLNKMKESQFDTKDDAKSALEYEVKLLRRYGAEVKCDDDRAYVIDESNNVSKIFDIE